MVAIGAADAQDFCSVGLLRFQPDALEQAPTTGPANTGHPSWGRCYPDEADTTTKPSVEMITETFNLLLSPARSRSGCITSCPTRHP